MIDPAEVEAVAAIDLSQRNTIITRQYPCGKSSREYLITREELFAEIERLRNQENSHAG